MLDFLLSSLETAIGKTYFWSFFNFIFRVQTVKKTDKRMNLMNEIISSMQVTKMFTREETFSSLVKGVRK